jgi:DNA-binding transcriptional ArsR family regulator
MLTPWTASSYACSTASSEPTILAGGKRIPGLKLDHPRQLALMHALVRFAHVAAGNSFRTCDLHALTAEALGCSLSQYRLSSLRYDLSKLRAKGLVEKIPGSRRYRLLPQGLLHLRTVPETL